MSKIKRVPGARVVVRPVRTPIKYGSIHLPPDSVKNTQTAKVVHVGDKITSMGVGDMVVFDRLAGVLVDKKKNLLLLKEGDVMAKVENYKEGEEK